MRIQQFELKFQVLRVVGAHCGFSPRERVARVMVWPRGEKDDILFGILSYQSLEQFLGESLRVSFHLLEKLEIFFNKTRFACC